MTQKKLSEASGVKMRHIQKIEAGDVDVRISTLGAISCALGIAPSTLLYPAKTTIPMMCEACIERNELLARPRQHRRNLQNQETLHRGKYINY